MAASKRTQRTAVSRERILDAAVEVLVESGYAGASTLEIQRRADVSRGRLTHHFPSRDELLVAAVSHLVETRIRQIYDSARKLPREPGERSDAAVEFLWKTFRQPYFWAAIELWVAARTAPSLAAALLPVERELYTGIRGHIDELFGAELAEHANFRALRSVLFTSMRGVALTYAFRPRTREPYLDVWKQTARAMLGISPSSPR